MEGSIKLNPVFSRGVKRHLQDIESWAEKVITLGVINKQTVCKPRQSSTFYWLVGNRNKGPTRFYDFDLPDRAFSSWNEN